jgi:hypothetical protein
MNTLLIEITKSVSCRMKYKYDAYFDLPTETTLDQIKELIRKISEMIVDEVPLHARLYSPHKLQVFWNFLPRRNIIEYLNDLSPIMDPGVLLKCYENPIG